MLDRSTLLTAHAATPVLADGDISTLTWMEPAGTAQPGATVVSNTTLFDFKGRALPVLDTWKQYTS